MYDLGIITLIALAAFVMLLRGDPKWALPALIGAVALFLVPTVTMLTIAYFTPQGSPLPPLFEIRQGEFFPYPYPAGSLQEALERNYRAIHETFEALLAAQQASFTALFAVASAETVVNIVASLTPGGAVVQLSKYALYVSKVGDPVLQISLTTYNAATAFVMVFHFLEFMAGAAVKMAVPLLALSLLAVIFGPTRALGGALLFFALIMIVPSYIGYYLAPVGKEFAVWGLETAKWLNATAANATGIAPVPLVVVEGTPHTLFLAGYNNTFVKPNAAELGEKMREVLTALNSTMLNSTGVPLNSTHVEKAATTALELAERYKVFEKTAFNGTDWVAATVSSVTPIAYGNKTWLYTTAINTWLDFPTPAPQEGGCISYGDFREFLDYLMPPDQAQRLKERAANLSKAICQFHQWLGYRSYHLQIDVPAHWRFLTVAVNYTARDRHGVVDRGVAYAHNGVWGWLSGPDNETCFNALGNKSNCAVLDTTLRVGRYNFSLWSGEKRVVNPATREVRSEFSFTVRNASQPVFGRSVALYRWVETCEWCCEYVNDTCARWCSSSRDVWQRANVTKRLGEGRYQYNATIYARPWVPEEERNYTGQIPVTTRDWEVRIRPEYGEWRGDGEPPNDASCYTHDNRTYMILSFFRAVPGPPRVLYAFTWMNNVGVWVYNRQGDPLPEVLVNYTDTDGVRVVHYLEGVEHQYYCYPAFVPTAAPRWRPVVDAERNLTKLLKDNYLTLVVIRNVSLAYFARVGPYLAAAEASNSSLARAAAASVREYLALVNKTPGAVPLYYTAPTSYIGRNVLIACVMYDWRAPVNLTAELRLHPGREWWVASYPMGASRVAKHVAEAKADMFKYVFGTPPPPPPVNLSGFVKQWRIPWNNRTLPYKPYYDVHMKMPPPDNETGIPLWNIQNLEDVQMTQSNVLAWLFTVLFVTILSIVAVFEFLGALFDFPTPMRAVFGFVIGVIQDWTYWLPFRVAVRGRLLLRIWLAVKRPVMRTTVRTAARVHSFFATRIPGLRYLRSPDLKEYYRRYVLWRREIAVRDPAEQIREEIRVKWRREALERVLRAAEERADVEWVKNLQRRAEEERRARIETARRIWNALRADNIIEAAREFSPRFDMWVQERVEMSRGSLSYHLFWWRLDRLPYMWRVLLNLDPHVVARLAAEGKIKPEDAALYLNLRAAVEAYMREMRRSWGWLHPLSLYVEQAREEFEKAKQRMTHEAEKGFADFRRFITEFQRRYEALRRYFTEDLSKLDEGERAKLEEAAKSVMERLGEAIRHFAVIDKAPRARIVAALNETLQRLAEGKAPQIPRDASLQDVVRHLALMDFNVAVGALRSAERYLEAHYAVAPTRYDTRQIAAEIVKWKIEEQLPTLKLAGAARGIVLGGRSAEEGEALLKAWGPRDVHGERWAVAGGRFRVVDVYEERPWEAVVGRFSYIHERPLDVREAVKIRPDMALTAEYAKYLAGFKAEEKALEVLRKAVEYRRIMDMLERAEELRLTPLAVERLTADAERLRREVLQETTEIFRRFREEFFFVRDLLEGHRVVRREVPEVREMVRAFEDALAEALKAPERRERVFREVFMERVERLVEEYAKHGDVEAVERIRRAAAGLAKIPEAVGWRAVEDVAVVLPAVGRAFEEALRAVGGAGNAARFVDVFKAKAEEAAKQLEQRDMRDAAERVRRAAEKIAEELYAGGWWAVERLRPLLSPERGGDMLGRLEFLHSLFTTGALETYRGLVYLRQVEEWVKEVKGLASAPGVAEEVLRRTADAVPSAKDDVENIKAALRAGRLAEAAEALGRVEDAASWWRSQNAETVEGVKGAVVLGREAVEYGRRVSELASKAGASEGEAARLLSVALEALRSGEYGVAAKQLEAVEKALGEPHILKLVREARAEAEGLARVVERLAEVLEKAPSPELEKALEAIRRGEAEKAREILTRIEAVGAAEEVVKAVKEAKSLIPVAQPEERVYALALAAAGVSGLEAAAVKTALDAAAGRNYSRALALTEAVEKAANERIAAVRDVEPLAKTLERLGLETRRLSSPEYRQRAVKEVEEVAAALRGLAELPTAVQRADAEKAAKAAEAFGLAETASLFKAIEKVKKEAGDVYVTFTKALAEALKVPEGERAETFRRVFASETEKMAKVFEERGLRTEAEGLRRAAEAAVKASESIAWRALEEVKQRLSSAVEAADKLIVKLRDEAVVRQVAEYGYYSALASLAREAGEVIAAKRDVEERLVKLIDDVKPAVELVAPHLKPLLEKLKAGDYSVLPAVEAELPKLAEQHRQLQRLVDELGEARKSLEKVVHIDKKVKELEGSLEKAPEDVKTVFGGVLKALEGRDFEGAVRELDKILKIIEEKRARLEPLEEKIREAKALAEQLGLEKVVKALERPAEKNVVKALGELERELARIYGALELVEYVRRPRADAEFGHAWAVVRMLGLEEADRLFKALSEVSLYLLREGREVFRNPLYDEVKHLVDQEWVRSLVKAPMYSYIVDRLGHDVLQPVYARWYGLFVEYGPYLNTAYEHAKTSAVKAGAPLGLTGGFSYAGKMMKWLGDFSQEAVMRGLKAYYKGEGRGFRELSEMTIRGAKIQLFDKAASVMMAKAAQMFSEAMAASEEAARRLEAEAHELKLLASVLRAKAAYEEIRLVKAYLKGVQRRAEALLREAERERDVDRKLALEAKAREMQESTQRKAEKHLADARVRYRAYLAEVRDFVKGHDVREVGMKYFGLTARAFVGDPQEVAEKMIRAVDVKRVISWADELKLPRELGEIAVRIADAERMHNKFEKILRAKAEPIPPVYDLEKAGRFFTDVRPHPPPQRSRLEEAVAKAVRAVFTAYYGRLRGAAERAAIYLALVKGDTRHASKEARRAYQALQKALKARDKEQALKALEELKAALKALGIEAEGEDVKTVLKAVEEKLRPAYEEYLNARREYASAVEAFAKFSPEAALALGEAANEGSSDSIGRWMSLVAYETGRRALEEYARFWARPVEERWDALPPAVREAVARREEEAVYELVRGVLKSAGIGVKKGVEMNLEGFEKALERVFTANGEWPEMRKYVRQVVETARRVQRGEADTKELEKAVDGLLAAYGARAAERFVRSDRLEYTVAEMHEGMRHYARNSGLKIGREAAERALLLGLSTMPEELVEAYAKGGWRGRLEPYVAYWTEDEKLARRAGEAGWEVRQIKRPVSFEEGVPKVWRTAYVVAPFGFDLSAVEKAVVEHVDGAREGVARVRPVEWPVPEAFLWFILRDRQPVREGDQIVAYSIDRLSIEVPLSKFGEALRGRNFDEMKRIVRELYETRLNRTLWQIVYEFDRERAEAALEYLRQRYGEPEGRLWERHDELYLTWLAFRLADEFEAYLKSGAGREFRAKEEFGDLLALGRWLPVDLAPLFWLRLVGDPEGGPEFKTAWVTAVNMWFERMAAPHTPKKPAVARRAVELFNAFVGAGFKYEELFPPPPPKPAEVKREAVKPETVVKPETAKPEAVKPAERLAQKPAVEVQRPEERGLRREVEKPEVGPQAVRPEVGKPEVFKPEAPKPEAEVVRGLRRGEKPRAPVVDVMRVESVDYLLEHFGVVLDIEAAFKAKSLATAKVRARLEKVAAKEPEFAHVLAEVAERVLSSFGRLMASPDAARHVYNALFYLFEGYETRDGELLFKMIEHTVREAVKKAEEADVPDAEYRIKQFILELIDILAKAGERYRRQALEGVSTVEKALRATAFAGLSAAALYSVYSGLYSEAVVSSVASAVALAEVGQFGEAVEYVQKAAKALYEAAKDVFEHVKITVQRLVELFVEAVARVLAWIDEHKAYLFLMAAVSAGVVALSAALNMRGLVELEKLAYAASLTPFIPAGVKEYSREEAFNVLWSAPDPYEKFKEIARDANAGRVKLAQPWESLRVLIMPKRSEERRLMMGKAYRELDERKKKGLFYAVLALEEAFGVYRSALRKYVETVQRVEVGEEPFKRVMYMANLRLLKQLAEKEEAAFEEALKILRRRLNEYAVMYGLRDLLDVKEDVARGLAEAESKELSKFKDVSFGVKAYAALIAYREYALGKRGVFGVAAWYWLEVGGSARLLYYAPNTAHDKAKGAKVERPVAVGEVVAEALRRLFLKPGADRYRGFVEELTNGGKLALELAEEKTKKTKYYVFRLYRVEEGGGRKELDVRLRISKVGKGIIYVLEFDDVERWRGFFGQELEAGVKAAEEVGKRLPVEDSFPYMGGWITSDVAIVRNREGERVLEMTTPHLWQLAETHALFDWSYVTIRRVSLTLEGPKPQFDVYASLEKLDDAIKKSAERGWLNMLGTKAGLGDLMDVKSWEGLKRWVADHWDVVVDAAVKRQGEGVRSELEALRDRLNDDKVAREVIAPALLLIQAERLGVNEATLKYFGAVVSSAIGGDGYVSAARKEVDLTSGEREIAQLWVAALAAHGIETEVRDVDRKFDVVASGGGAARLAGLYFRYGPPLLEGDERIINHKLAEAVKLGAEGLNVSWEGLRRTEGGLVAADLIISVGGAAVKYNIYLRKDILLQFQSTDRGRVELAARLLKLAGVSAEVNKVESSRDVWRVVVSTDILAAGRKELRDALVELIRAAVEKGWVNADKADLWLEKLERGRVLMEGWPKYNVRLAKGALVVSFSSPNPDSIEQVAQRFREMGLVEGVHFTVKMPEGGEKGYVSILRKGLERAAWLSVHGEGEQRELAAKFVEYILQRAKEESKEVYEKAREVIDEGKARGSLTLKGFEKEVEVNGKKYKVKVRGGEAVEEDRGGKKLLRIKITAEVGDVRSDYVMTYGRYGARNAVVGRAYARADAPGGREADAERFSALVEALTGKRPRVYRKSDGTIEIEYGREHLDGFKRYIELTDAIEKWLEETGS